MLEQAVLARLARTVVTIEVIDSLARRAAADLQRLGISNVTVIRGNGRRGYPPEAPYDGILVSAGSEDIPKDLLDQLRPGGRILIPVGVGDGSLDLLRLEKGVRGDLTRERLLPVRFVPRTGD